MVSKRPWQIGHGLSSNEHVGESENDSEVSADESDSIFFESWKFLYMDRVNQSC